MRLITNLRRSGAALAFVMAGVLFPSAAQAGEVPVAATETLVTMEGGVVNARFKVAVQNPESSALTNVQVILEDASVIAIGDVFPGEAALSGPESRVFTAPHTSRSQSLRATLRYTLGDATLDQPTILHLTVQD